MNCSVNVMYDSTLLIFYGELKKTFSTHRHSPYRNYVRHIYRRHDASERVLYLTVLDESMKISTIEKQLVNSLGTSARITVSEYECDGYKYLKVFFTHRFQTTYAVKAHEAYRL
ncbi:hypothetical protein SAMN02910406_03784 [Ruminococcus albus]|uniref:Uncharacterized protein n=2 Tax=Ruminococcus albus TaxID=1264 RepID=A0A1I1RW00_RUMAL|nr:hypothetical protein SAMN02910406_03784 [Ruminococcus albus]